MPEPLAWINDYVVHSDDDDAVAFLLDSSFKVLASNDDGGDDAFDSHIVFDLGKSRSATHFIAFRDHAWAKASFTVELHGGAMITETKLCEAVKPEDIQCGGRANRHLCPDGFECADTEASHVDGPGVCEALSGAEEARPAAVRARRLLVSWRRWSTPCPSPPRSRSCQSGTTSATYNSGSFQRVRKIVAQRFPDFPRVLVPGAWYPTAALFTVVETAHDLFGPDDFYERCGHAIVDYEVSVFFRFALKFTSPAWIVDKATESWRRAHSTGVWEVVSPSPGYIEARLLGFETTAVYCRLLTAYFQRLFQLSGARDVRVKHPRCRARGEETCRYVTTWREKH